MKMRRKEGTDDPDNDIVKAVRDGTVVFEREPEPQEVTIKLTKEQIESLKEQGSNRDVSYEEM